MPVDLSETRLPGIGVKYGFRTSEGGRLAIVLHNDGIREIYFFRHDHDEEASEVIRLDDVTRYRLRRRSDGSVIPTLFDEKNLRFFSTTFVEPS